MKCFISKQLTVMGSMEISLGTKSPMETFHYGEVDGGSVIYSLFLV